MIGQRNRRTERRLNDAPALIDARLSDAVSETDRAFTVLKAAIEELRVAIRQAVETEMNKEPGHGY